MTMPFLALLNRYGVFDRRAFAILFFFLFLSGAIAVYNDEGNDSCLIIYSDSGIYRPNNINKPNAIQVYLTIENNCGEEINAIVGLQTEKRHTSLITLNEALIKETKSVVPATPITNAITKNTLPYLTIGKEFETKVGWENIFLKDGNTSIVLDLIVPSQKGEFVITAFNPLKPEQQSILDPTYLGAGSIGDPYIITTCVELQDVNSHTNDSSVYFKLGNHIDCSMSKTWVKADGTLKGFAPIATEASPFKGHFDGDYYSISEVTIYNPVDTSCAGIFGCLSGSDVNNLGIIDVNIVALTNRSGAIAGSWTTGGAISQVYVQGGAITGTQYTGGLVGLAQKSAGYDLNIFNCYVKDVNVSNGVSADIGGIFGYFVGTIYNSYTVAKVTSAGANKGAMVGRIGAPGLSTYSFWNPTDSTQATSALGTESTQANMKKQATYVGWDFVNVWTIEEDLNTPILTKSSFPFYPENPDLNFVSIGGELFVFPTKTFAYILDGNLAINFNVFASDNNRLSIDINYSSSLTAGTGTSIVKDLNLDSSVCSVQNWNVTPSLCSWDFNILGTLVPDGNYYLLGKLKNNVSLTSVTKASPTTFLIANDVNVVVKVPIDEETGLAINTTSVYTWVVRIYNSTGMSYYPSQRDQNTFIVPLGDHLLFEIDTNTSDFYPRQYSLLFSEATSQYILQPYLIKQAVSGNFIFNVTNIATTAPIPNVRIQIFGFVPSSGQPELQNVVTDSAGLATIPLRLNTPYTVKFYLNGTLVHSVEITPTTSSLYYQVQLSIDETIVPIGDLKGSLTTVFYPKTGFIVLKSNGSVDINAEIGLTQKTVNRIQIRVYDTNGCFFHEQFYTAPWTDGNTVVLNVDLNTGLATYYRITNAVVFCEYNEMFSVFMVVDVNSTDANVFSASSIHWQLLQDHNYKYNLLYLLSLFTKNLNTGSNKLVTTFLAFLICVIIASALGAKGGGDPLMAGMLSIGIICFFVFIEWVDSLPAVFFGISCLIAILYFGGKYT